MQNLYKLLTGLVEERAKLNDRGNIIKYDVKRGDAKAKEEFDKITARYNNVDAQINIIKDEYAIDIKAMGEIISRHTGKRYVPKIFIKVYQEDGQSYYSHNFIACYINDQNPYYLRRRYAVGLMEDEFKNLINSLDATQSIVFSTSKVLRYVPFSPQDAFRGTNFIKKYIYGNQSIDEISDEFMDKFEPILRIELEKTNIITNDENAEQIL